MRSPVEIEVLLHYHYSPEPYPRINAPACQEALKMFLQEGMLESIGQVDQATYTTTTRGAVWVEMLCNTPFPGKVWMDPRDKQNTEIRFVPA